MSRMCWSVISRAWQESLSSNRLPNRMTIKEQKNTTWKLTFESQKKRPCCGVSFATASLLRDIRQCTRWSSLASTFADINRNARFSSSQTTSTARGWENVRLRFRWRAAWLSMEMQSERQSAVSCFTRSTAKGISRCIGRKRHRLSLKGTSRCNTFRWKQMNITKAFDWNWTIWLAKMART